MKSASRQLTLPLTPPAPVQALPSARDRVNGTANRLELGDRAFHDWYRFVLSFPPHLVRRFIQEFGLDSRHTVLDPFCGTGTTLVEARLAGSRAVGLEANAFAQFASSVKLDWGCDADLLLSQARVIGETARGILSAEGIDDDWPCTEVPDKAHLRTLPPEAMSLLLTDSISPLPLHKTLLLRDLLHGHRDRPYYRHALLALANALVFKVSNLHFGPEVGVSAMKLDPPVIAPWLSEVGKMADDLRTIAGSSYPESEVFLADARQISQVIEPSTVDAVITSPPYPNEKDYTRTTRLESVVFGFVENRAALRAMKRGFVRSNTRGVYKGDDDDAWVKGHPEIQRIANAIEERRVQLGKSSGFERMYARVTRLYFGGMARHLADLRTVLRPGARLAYVVGDQASYLRVMIRTGHLLAEIAVALGYELERIDLFRTRFATATREQLREEVVVLHWPGHRGKSGGSPHEPVRETH